MDKSILIIEDDEITRSNLKKFFKMKSFSVETAENGQKALDIVEKDPEKFSCFLLDLKLPTMDGQTFLSSLKEREIAIPPVVVFSAHLGKEAVSRCIELGVKCLLKKPYENQDIEKVINILISDSDDQMTRLIEADIPTLRLIFNPQDEMVMVNLDWHEWPDKEHSINEHSISIEVKKREDALEKYFKSESSTAGLSFRFDEPLLIVGRRWNSWYPSFFDVPGGAYAIVGPQNADNRCPTVVIDPGFKFLSVFRDLGISVRDISRCIISHNHPDHIGGIFEYMAARHVLGEETNIFCNTATTHMLGNTRGFKLEIKEISEDSIDLLNYQIEGTDKLQIRLRGVKTKHEEIGMYNTSLAVNISSYYQRAEDDFDKQGQMVILGDTQYIRHEHKHKFMPVLVNPHMKVVVLHIGCSQLKTRTGGHLYLPGLKKILIDMDAELDTTQFRGKLLVLVSEWGLEHATDKQVSTICGESIEGFTNRSPILDTIITLQKDLSKINLLPADIGLMVGIHSGDIYFKNGSHKAASEIDFQVGCDGIEYLP